MRNKENNPNEIYFKKFQIAKIKNPQKILGGNRDDDDGDVTTGSETRETRNR